MKKELLFCVQAILIGASLMSSCSKDDEESDSGQLPLTQLPDGNCPNTSHPHMIDLGLPSGTKWACCNLGANKPKEYGNYYAWGETQPKSKYNWETYKYGSSWDKTVSIGSDIAGTQYDAATVNWGASWRMPTYEQCIELLNNCSSKWASLDGVSGYQFTGPSGSTIFLPAAGWNGNDIGKRGYYWSSTLYSSSSSARHLTYAKLDTRCGDNYRCDGQSIRPVRKN